MVKMTVAEVNVNLRYLAIKYNKRLMYLAIKHDRARSYIQQSTELG